MAQTPDRFLVTAGSTRESIDRVRDWGNIFTGNTGLAIATELSRLGPVDLFTSNAAHIAAIAAEKPLWETISTAAFRTHEELKGLLTKRMERQVYRGVFMSAAVSDYRPDGVYEIISREPTGGEERWVVRNVQAEKVRSNFHAIAVRGERTEKLVDLFRSAWGFAGLLVKFKLEVGLPRERLLEIGRASRKASGANYLVANTLEMVTGEGAGAFLIGPDDEAQFVPRDKLASRLAEVAAASR